VVCRPISFLCCFGGGESGGLGEGGREEGKAELANGFSFPSFSASVRVLYLCYGRRRTAAGGYFLFCISRDPDTT